MTLKYLLAAVCTGLALTGCTTQAVKVSGLNYNTHQAHTATIQKSYQDYFDQSHRHFVASLATINQRPVPTFDTTHYGYAVVNSVVVPADTQLQLNITCRQQAYGVNEWQQHRQLVTTLKPGKCYALHGGHSLSYQSHRERVHPLNKGDHSGRPYPVATEQVLMPDYTAYCPTLTLTAVPCEPHAN